MTSIPKHFWIQKKIRTDNSTVKSNVFGTRNTDGDNLTTLNKSSDPLRFSFKGQNKFFRLGSPRSGFRFNVSFRTQTPANTNNANANTTLASNFAMYLFNRADFYLADQMIESVQNLGTATDILFHTKGAEYRDHVGQLSGFIPDTTSSAVDSLISQFKFNAQPADLAATAVSRPVTIVSNYNAGYHKRKMLYNYTTANNNEIREIQVFIPLSAIFGFCNDYDRVLKFINFDIDLLRESDTLYYNAVFGANDTTIQIGQDDETGIKSICLEIEEILPEPDLVKQLDKIFDEGPIEIAFMTRDCSRHIINEAAEHNISLTKFNLARYIFIVCRGTQGNAVQNTPTTNFQLFRHADIHSIQAFIDSEPYPNLLQNADFNRNIYSRFYQEFLNCSRKIEGCDSSLSMEDYKNLFTIYAIDLSAQKEKLKATGTNITITVQRRAVPDNNDSAINPRHLALYVLVLSEVAYSVDCKAKTVKKLN